MTLEGQVAHYRILGKLGAGGMGEVYRAEDTRLGRQVAIKVLPPDLAEEADRVARFKREATLLAALQHPRIAAIHGVEEVDGRRLLVLELVEGEDLAERLKRGALEEELALSVARQLAEALEAAHDKGIVHRDLKPANIKLTPDGSIKVLDFGLAKALGEESVDGLPPGMSMTPTVTRATQAGVILGTAPYMSPEQARGRAVDRRADIWAFGCVLYEVLTGKRAFDGESTTDILAAVVKEDPDWAALPADLPPTIPLLLRRCLVKDPRRRLQAIGEARVTLETGEDPGLTAALSFVMPGSGATTQSSPSLTQRTGILPWFVLSLAIIMGAVVLIVIANVASDRGGPVIPALPTDATGQRFEIVVSESPLASSGGAAVVLSPDSRRLAWVADSEGTTRLFVRELGQATGRPLPGTEGARGPFFSPDGEWIGFFDATHLKQVNVNAGAPLKLSEVTDPHGGTWTHEGRIVFAPGGGGLAAVPAGGGELEELTAPDDDEQVSHRWPCAGNSEWLVFVSMSGGGPETEFELRLLSLESGEERSLLRGARYPRLGDDRILFVREGTLFSARLETDSEVSGDPRPLVEDVQVSESGDAQYDWVEGTLVFRRRHEGVGRAHVVLGFDAETPLSTR